MRSTGTGWSDRPVWPWAAWLAVALLAGCGVDPASGGEAFSRSTLFLGTVCRVDIRDRRPPEELFAVWRDAARQLRVLEAAVRFDHPDGDLARLNLRAGGPPEPVSPDLLDLLVEADRAWRASRGVFDPTVKPLLRLWGFYAQGRIEPVPADAADTRRLVGFGGVWFDPAAGRARLEKPGMGLDMGGLVKGAAVDRCVAVFRAAGLTDFQVDLGGSSRYAIGEGPDGGWGVRVVGPGEGFPPLQIRLDGVSLAVSGGRGEWETPSGQRFSALVDPRTGRPTAADRTAVVLAPSGARADAAATVICIDPEVADESFADRLELTAWAWWTADGPVQLGPDPARAAAWIRVPAAGVTPPGR